MVYMENPIKMDDLGGKPTIFGNAHVLKIIKNAHHKFVKNAGPGPDFFEGSQSDWSDLVAFRRQKVCSDASFQLIDPEVPEAQDWVPQVKLQPQDEVSVHPGRLTAGTCPHGGWEDDFPKWVICMFHVNLPGCRITPFIAAMEWVQPFSKGLDTTLFWGDENDHHGANINHWLNLLPELVNVVFFRESPGIN